MKDSEKKTYILYPAPESADRSAAQGAGGGVTSPAHVTSRGSATRSTSEQYCSAHWIVVRNSSSTLAVETVVLKDANNGSHIKLNCNLIQLRKKCMKVYIFSISKKILNVKIFN